MGRAKHIFRIKITLVGSEPKIWRRFDVLAAITLPDLHRVIQAVMGWEDKHLHKFRFDDEVVYGPPEVDLDNVRDERNIILVKALKDGNAYFTYDYDFGDGWEHSLEVERLFGSEPGKHYPVCIAGKRACPFEDCGGIDTYHDLLDAYQEEDPEDENWAIAKKLFAKGYTPDVFSLRPVNQRLRRITLKTANRLDGF